MKVYLVFWIHISLLMNTTEHLLLFLLAICTSLEKCVYSDLLSIFRLDYLSLFLSCNNFSHVFWLLDSYQLVGLQMFSPIFRLSLHFLGCVLCTNSFWFHWIEFIFSKTFWLCWVLFFAQAVSSCSEWGPLCVLRGLLIAVALLLWSMGSGHWGSVVPGL